MTYVNNMMIVTTTLTIHIKTCNASYLAYPTVLLLLTMFEIQVFTYVLSAHKT